MITPLSHPDTRRHTGASAAGSRLGRRAADLAAITCSLLATVTDVPAAFARPIPPPGGSWTTSVTPLAPATVRVITTGGMAGWQITLIALAAALAAATAAVFIDRAGAARRAAPATTA